MFIYESFYQTCLRAALFAHSAQPQFSENKFYFLSLSRYLFRFTFHFLIYTSLNKIQKIFRLRIHFKALIFFCWSVFVFFKTLIIEIWNMKMWECGIDIDIHRMLGEIGVFKVEKEIFTLTQPSTLIVFQLFY